MNQKNEFEADGCVTRRQPDNKIVISAKTPQIKLEIHFSPEDFTYALMGQVSKCTVKEIKYK